MQRGTKILENGPVLVVVSGAPGSGKSTLAKILSEKLNFLHIERDVLLEQIYQLNKQNPDYDKAKVGIPKAYEIVANLLSEKVSIVMDATLYKNISEVDIKAFGKNAKLLNIHCVAGNFDFVIERFRKREIARNSGSAPDWLNNHIKILENIYEDVVKPLDLECPQLVVTTEATYDPTIGSIIDWVAVKAIK